MVLEEQMRAMKSTRRKLETSEEKRFWRSWRHQKHSSQKLVTRSWRHQKHLKIIRSWRSSEAGRLKNFKMLFKWRLNHACHCKYWENKTTAISNEFEGIECLFSWEHWKKGLLYEVYNHYLHYFVFVSASTRTTAVPATVFL